MQSIPAAGPVSQPSVTTLTLANAGIGSLDTNTYDCGGAFTFFSAAITTSGTFTTGTAQLQGSNDGGTTWFNIGSATAITTGNQLFTSGTTVVGPFRQIRLHVTVAVTGGGSIGTLAFACAGA